MNKLIVSALVPFVALLLWVISLELRLVSGTAIRIRVEGYDPRDLLSGHYILFRISMYDIDPCKDTARDNACVCFGYDKDDLKIAKPIWGGLCSSAPDYCVLKMKGRCEGSRFTGLDRYYIPERLAPVLQTVPADSSADVVLSKNGEAQITNFYVGDETLESYAEKRLLEIVPTPIAGNR